MALLLVLGIPECANDSGAARDPGLATSNATATPPLGVRFRVIASRVTRGPVRRNQVLAHAAARPCCCCAVTSPTGRSRPVVPNAAHHGAKTPTRSPNFAGSAIGGAPAVSAKHPRYSLRPGSAVWRRVCVDGTAARDDPVPDRAGGPRGVPSRQPGGRPKGQRADASDKMVAGRIVLHRCAAVRGSRPCGSTEVFAQCDYEIELVSPECDGSAAINRGCESPAAPTSVRFDRPIDTLWVVAGPRPLGPLTNLSALAGRRCRRKARRVGASCLGTFVLAASGALQGRRCSHALAVVRSPRRALPAH